MNRASLGLLFVTFIWGSTFVAVKVALEDSSPLLFVAARFALAALFALALLGPRPGLKKALVMGLPLGVVLGGGYAAQTIGLTTTTPTRSAFLTSLAVALVPFWSPLVLRRPPGLFPILGLFLCLPGIWLLTSPGGGNWNSGDSWTVVCALLFSLHIVLITRVGAVYDTGGLLFSQLGVTAVLAGLASVIFEVPRLQPTRAVLGGLLLTAVLATTLTTWLQLKLQPKVSATRTAVLFAMEPVFATLFSIVFFGERLTRGGWAGAALILAGILLSELGSERTQWRRSRTGPEPAA